MNKNKKKEKKERDPRLRVAVEEWMEELKLKRNGKDFNCFNV